MMRWLIVVAFALAVMAVLAMSALPAGAQDRLQSQRPMGYFGEGHEAHHQHYINLKNANNGSCCNGLDCRPTQARWNGTTWDVMVNGVWRTLKPSETYTVLTPEVFAKQGISRWDSQAHVCTSYGDALLAKIYCVIPPASGG